MNAGGDGGTSRRTMGTSTDSISTGKARVTVQAGWAGEYGVMRPDGKPVTYCAGGCSVVPGSGTGRFARLSGGGGNWCGHAGPNEDFEVNWSGVAFFRSASQR